MATAVKKCRVCGKSYEACRTVSKTPGVFRWQEVACSPDCGAEYLRRVMAARSPAPVVPEHSEEPHMEAPIVETVEAPADEVIGKPDVQVQDDTFV